MKEDEEKEEVLAPERKENWEVCKSGVRSRRWLCVLDECLGINEAGEATQSSLSESVTPIRVIGQCE